METTAKKTRIQIGADIKAPVQKVWDLYNDAKHVVKWNNPSPDWHTPKAENDFRVGGNFVYTMAARDGSAQFDFGGTYDKVDKHKQVHYVMGDGRDVTVTYKEQNGGTRMDVDFEAETQNSIDMQRDGWQGILNNFKNYVEAQK
jgi:uncharacterized protein YndB with AHSA1/START domain